MSIITYDDIFIDSYVILREGLYACHLHGFIVDVISSWKDKSLMLYLEVSNFKETNVYV